MITSIVDPAVSPLQAATTPHPGAPARIKNATLQKFGPDGKARAERVHMDYSQTHLDDDGHVVGGVVKLLSRFQGASCYTGSVQFSPEGRAARVNTTVYDRIAGGIHRVVESDLSGLHWIHGRVSDGTISLQSRKQDGTLVSTGTIVFAGEKLSRADVETQAPGGSGGLDRKTSLDFSGTEFLGTEIVGGAIEMQSRRADGHLLAECSTSYGATGLPKQLSLKVYGEAGPDIRSIVELDFAGAQFNALKEIDSGVLAITTTRPTGDITSKGQLTYQGTVPATYAAETYTRRGTLFRRISIDYKGVHFNQARRPVNSRLSIELTDAAGKLIFTTTVNYGPDGVPVHRQVRSHSARDGVADVVSEVDCRRAVYHSRRVIVGGQTTTTTMSGRLRTEVVRSFTGTRHCSTKETHISDVATSSPRCWAKTYYRPNGVVLKLVKVTMGPTGQPQTGSVTSFATDGRTVVTSRKIDYSKVTYAAGALSGGTITLATRDGRSRPRSRGQVTFG